MAERPARTLLLAALVAGACAPAAGAADPRIKAEYDYTVSAKGTQTTTWTSEGPGIGGCDVSNPGSGTQVVTFRSKKMRMHTYDGIPQPFFNKPGDRGGLELALRGTVDRRNSVACEASDCGAKPFKGLQVNPRYLYGRNRVVLDQSYTDGLPDFDACLLAGDVWPLMLEEADGKPVGRDLRATDLFRKRRTVLVATGTRKESDFGVSSTTTIRWELTFTRIKRTPIRR